MIVYNYTRVQRRDKRIYTLFDTTISKQGISINTIKSSVLVLSIFTIFGILFCSITGKFWYNPKYIIESSSVGYFYTFFVLIPISIGVMLDMYKIQNYRALDYIKLYIQPRTPLDHNGRKVKPTGYKIDSFVERL